MANSSRMGNRSATGPFLDDYYFDDNDTFPAANATPTFASLTLKHDANVRILTLSIMVVFGVVGNMLVFAWMWRNRRRKSNVNYMILGLAIADLSVVTVTMLTQIIWESLEERWFAGNVMCKVIKVGQALGLMASSNMLVVIAIDRHHAIRSPMKVALPAKRMIVAAYSVALVCSLPQAYIFREVTLPTGESFCKAIFSEVERWHLQAYITYVAMVLFSVPLLIIIVAYARILKKISDRVRDGKSPLSTSRSNRIYIQSNNNDAMIRAKMKTLKMTMVIILTFIICGTPYFIVEMWTAFGDPATLDMRVVGVLGIFASANTATNPFVFLYFNTKSDCLSSIFGRRKETQKARNTTRLDGTEMGRLTAGATIARSESRDPTHIQAGSSRTLYEHVL
ncbi:neuropeptide S receptor-like [Branchiostoma floridae]|uniref:Neuropeptide S receptor-like n=2 Tax=Branchiostoma floridae TaxID=7739 RepID=A0A9J7KPS4_BRAFL|nr:neuropeptide S receptor-like [Branchiostoma floridae]